MILKGRRAIIAGASFGVGAAMAEEFVREAARAASRLSVASSNEDVSGDVTVAVWDF